MPSGRHGPTPGESSERENAPRLRGLRRGHTTHYRYGREARHTSHRADRLVSCRAAPAAAHACTHRTSARASYSPPTVRRLVPPYKRIRSPPLLGASASGNHCMLASMASCSACVLAPLMLSICLPPFHCARAEQARQRDAKESGRGGVVERRSAQSGTKGARERPGCASICRRLGCCRP